MARPPDNDDARDDWLDQMMIEADDDGAREGVAAGHSDESAEQLRARLHAGIDEVLGAGGLLSEEGGHYEERPQQLQMARAVADAFVANKPAVIEAGTGTGKTLAYLVPALLEHGFPSGLTPIWNSSLDAAARRSRYPLLAAFMAQAGATDADAASLGV